MTGTVLSQVLSILFVPVLARLYSSDDYGISAAVISIATILAAVVSCALQNAIILAHDDESAQKIANVNIYLSFFTCTFFFIVFLFTKSFIAHSIFRLPQMENWILIVPLYTLVTSFYVITQFYANRKQYYKAISSSRLIGVIFNLGIAFTISFFSRTEFGLIAGLLTGQIIGFLILLWKLQKEKSHLFALPAKAEFRNTFKNFRKFPLYSMPADLINVFTSQLPIVMVSHTPSVAGQYSMSNRILGVPAVFLSGAITDVFKQRAAKDFRETGTARPIFLKALKSLSLLAVGPFLILGIFGADIFAFVLGEEWRQAGVISQILSLMFFFKFIISPLTYIIYIAGKNWFSFVMDSIGFVATYLVFHFFLYDVNLAFMLYSAVYVVLSTVTLLFCLYIK